MKKCSKCKIAKPLHDFYNHPIQIKQSRCKECTKYAITSKPRPKLTEKQLIKKRARYRKYKPGIYYVYLLPHQNNYVGYTELYLKDRMRVHKNAGNDTTNYKPLHAFITKKEAKTKEAHYHSLGYSG